jgi:hypothetical protein
MDFQLIIGTSARMLSVNPCYKYVLNAVILTTPEILPRRQLIALQSLSLIKFKQRAV